LTLSSVPGLQYVLWRDERRRSVTRIQRSGFRPFRNIRGVRGSKRSSGWAMSALPPEADIRRLIEHVCFVPKADPPRRPWCRIQSAGPSQSPPSVTAGWDASRTAPARGSYSKPATCLPRSQTVSKGASSLRADEEEQSHRRTGVCPSGYGRIHSCAI